MSQEVLIKQGTPKTWQASGGDAKVDLAGLANGAGVRGGVIDLGATFAKKYLMTVEIELAAAPTAGTTIEIYLARSHDGATWPGGAYGEEGPYKPGEVAEWKKQFGTPDGILTVTADGSATVQTQTFTVYPNARYVSLVVVNAAGQAVKSDGTNQRVTLTPLITELQ